MRAEARAHGGEVTVRGEFPVIEGDDVLLRQAFSNLLRNAVEACVDAAIAPQVVVDGRVDAGTRSRVVDDNGPGVAPPDRERIFRPFVTTKGRGTGSGARARAEDHRDPQRPHSGGVRRRRRRELPDRPAHPGATVTNQ